MSDINNQPKIDYDAFRTEVQEFLNSEYTPVMREKNQRQAGLFCEPDLGLWWQRKLNERGWGAPAWPAEYGGTGWDPVQRFIFESECSVVGTPSFAIQGIVLVGPALIRYGTQEQKDYFLPKILSGDIYFCQGFSEPGSGSDLASMKTEAVRDGDDYVVNGSKIWTTHAHYANWIFVLVRTASEAKAQRGISFLLAPMDTPGITVHPIISISGEHELNQTFFDDARVPLANRVGDENKGWDVTKYLLEFERGGLIYSAQGAGLLSSARHIASKQVGDETDTLAEDRDFRRKAAELEIDLMALGAMEKQSSDFVAAGNDLGDVAAAVAKVMGTQLYQSCTELCVEALGDYALADQRETLILSNNTPAIGPDYAAKPVAKYLNARASSIYGGSNEVMRNVIARRELNLP